MSMQDHSATARGRAFLWGGLALGLLLAAGLLTHGFGLFGSGKAATAEAPGILRRGLQIIIPNGSPLRARLAIAPVASELVSPGLTLPGIVEADPARTATVLTALAGRVVQLKVGLGDRVVRGEVLAVIDSPDLAQAYDDNVKAADSFELTRKNLARQEGQHRLGALSDHDLDQARSDYAQASAEYTRTRARLRALGAPLEGAARTSLLAVRAPLNGSVTALSVAAGNLVNDPTQPMMTIADLSTVWVTALVPENQVAAVGVGEPATVQLAAYPGTSLRGRVSSISDVIEADSRRDKVRIAFPNPALELRPNMFATVLLSGRPETRIVVPTSALLMNNDRTSVFVAVAPWTFERRTVDAQLQEGDRVVIDSGLEAGEQVVISGGILLND